MAREARRQASQRSYRQPRRRTTHARARRPHCHSRLRRSGWCNCKGSAIASRRGMARRRDRQGRLRPTIGLCRDILVARPRAVDDMVVASLHDPAREVARGSRARCGGHRSLPRSRGASQPERPLRADAQALCRLRDGEVAWTSAAGGPDSASPPCPPTCPATASVPPDSLRECPDRLCPQ